MLFGFVYVLRALLPWDILPVLIFQRSACANVCLANHPKQQSIQVLLEQFNFYTTSMLLHLKKASLVPSLTQKTWEWRNKYYSSLSSLEFGMGWLVMACMVLIVSLCKYLMCMLLYWLNKHTRQSCRHPLFSEICIFLTLSPLFCLQGFWYGSGGEIAVQGGVFCASLVLGGEDRLFSLTLEKL